MSLLRPAVLVLVVSIAAAPSARASGASPVQISLFAPVQIVPMDKSVWGLRLDLIYGKNANVTGLDWGLVNHDTGDGLQLGLANFTETMHGLQIGAGNIIQKGKIPFLPIVNWSL